MQPVEGCRSGLSVRVIHGKIAAVETNGRPRHGSTQVATAEAVTASNTVSTGEIVMAGTARWKERPWRHPTPAGTWFMAYTTAGRARYRLGPTQVTTTVGDLVLVHFDAPFEYSVPGPNVWAHHSVCFDMWSGWRPPPPFAQLATGLFRAHVGLMQAQHRIESAFGRLISDVRARDAAEALACLRKRGTTARHGIPDPRRELALAAIHEILLLVSADAAETAQLDPRIAGALQIITNDLAAHHDMNALARTAGLSTSRFLHLFREQLGMSPRRTIRALRLQQAALRLAFGNEPVGRIAEEIGFTSLFDLSRAFRKAYGVSASAYREQSRILSLPPRWRGISAESP